MKIFIHLEGYVPPKIVKMESDDFVALTRNPIPYDLK